MDLEQLVARLLDRMETVLERVTRVEGKLDAYNGLTKRLNDIENRVSCLELKPGKNWNTLTVAILVAIGTAIGAGVVSIFFK